MGEKKFRVIAINGSPRAKKGMTEQVVRRFTGGAESAGAEAEVVYLASLNIEHCLGCLHCWFRTPGRCRHDDDMPSLMEKLGGADLIVFASPVYVDGMTGQMKTMFDRFCTYTPPFFERGGERSYHPKVTEKDPRVVIISTCGFPERVHLEAIALHFRRICENMRADVVGEFYFPASSLIAMEPAIVEPNLKAMERAGREAVACGAISAGTVEAANLEYVVDPGAFNEKINEVFHTLRKHHGAE